MLLLERLTDSTQDHLSPHPCHSPFVYSHSQSAPTGVTKSVITPNSVCKDFSHSSPIPLCGLGVFLFLCLFRAPSPPAIPPSGISSPCRQQMFYSPDSLWCAHLYSKVIRNDRNLNPTCALICTRHRSDIQELSWMPVLTFLFYFLM